MKIGAGCFLPQLIRVIRVVCGCAFGLHPYSHSPSLTLSLSMVSRIQPHPEAQKPYGDTLPPHLRHPKSRHLGSPQRQLDRSSP